MYSALENMLVPSHMLHFVHCALTIVMCQDPLHWNWHQVQNWHGRLSALRASWQVHSHQGHRLDNTGYYIVTWEQIAASEVTSSPGDSPAFLWKYGTDLIYCDPLWKQADQGMLEHFSSWQHVWCQGQWVSLAHYTGDLPCPESSNHSQVWCQQPQGFCWCKTICQWHVRKVRTPQPG